MMAERNTDTGRNTTPNDLRLKLRAVAAKKSIIIAYEQDFKVDIHLFQISAHLV